MYNFVLDTPKKVKQKIMMLQSLADIQFAQKILQEASVEKNQLDSSYKKLKCDITPLDPNSKEFKLITEYVNNTHANTHSWYTLEIQDIFKLDRNGESRKFKRELGNRMLLWHGSRLTNWVGILSRGMRIAPPEAPSTGYMFGKGVYFADMVSKSANYCYTS